MKILLVRVGIDHTAGGWNAPVDTETNDFVYVPIPEHLGEHSNLKYKITYDNFVNDIKCFCEKIKINNQDYCLPKDTLSNFVHLDPDFRYLTYGDKGKERGKRLNELDEDDIIIFYAGLKPINKKEKRLVYALIGLYTIDRTIPAKDLPESDRIMNAHSRKENIPDNDIIVFGKAGKSGRFDRCIPIGEFRDKVYRVRNDILKEWGGLGIKDGYIHRSFQQPYLTNPEKFLKWLKKFDIKLIERNN
jgi:hypothetical protein